jgi:hypothetical protein
MSVTRAWYTYNETIPGGNLNSSNYFYLSFFPSCQSSGTEICGVYGIYDDGVEFPYGDHPKPFSPRLESYINAAFSLSSSFPTGSGVKRFVYVKTP